jgi:uncharacterized protein (DUF433 family)
LHEDPLMNDNATAYVTQTPQGGWRIAGTRVSLDSIVSAYWDGQLPEAITADFPSLTLEQIHGAIAFYLRHRPVLDRYLADQDARWRQFQQESAARHGPLLQRIRQAASQRYARFRCDRT